MKRLILALIVIAGCAQSTQPGRQLSYFLASIDTKPLPATPIGWPADQRFEAASLSFGSIGRPQEGSSGTAAYTVTINGQTSTSHYHFRVTSGILHIDLCPIGALCVAVLTELVGPIDGDQLVLTYSVGGGPASSVFRFQAALPD